MAASADSAVRAVAAQARERYQYPVDSQLFDAEGVWIGQLAMNALFSERDPEARYLEFLERAGGAAAPRRK